MTFRAHPPSHGRAPSRGGEGRPGALRILVACEYSATVRDAFRARGFDAWSCDLLPTEGDPRWHIQGDVTNSGSETNETQILGHGWDLMISHPPCTHLAVSGARHFAAKREDGRQQAALDFVGKLLAAPIRHKALENPVSIISSHFRKPDQIIQPWQYGHGETKATCLWLDNLPKLRPTDIVEGREARIHRMPPGPDRWKERSRTFQGIADAMARQWGDYLLSLQIARASICPIRFDTNPMGIQFGKPLHLLPIDTDSDPGSFRKAMRFWPFDGRTEGWFNRPDNTGGDLPNSDENISHNPTDSSERQ